MAITWGAIVSDSSNAFRIGYEFTQSPSTVSNGTTSVTVTLKIYLGTKYYAYDSAVNWAISGSIASSGSISFDHNSGTAWSSSNQTLLATRTRTVTPSFSGTVSTSITATVSGLAAIAGTASVSGTWTTAKRPIIAPDAPTGLTATRVSDGTTTLDWNNVNPTDVAAPYQGIEIERYDYETSGPWTNIYDSSVIETRSATGTVADKKYAFRVRATNTAGASGYTANAVIFTTPSTPTNVKATRNVNDIDVTWTNNATFADQWEVWHRTNGVRDGAALATVSVPSYKHVAPNTGQQHSYEIRAKVSSGSGATISAYSTASGSIQLTDNPPGAVSSVTPATSTITTPKPTLGLTMAAIATGQTQKGQWQFATDTGFTTGVVLVEEPDADLRLSGATTEAPTLAQLTLTNGTWYMRARAIDINGVPGPWSATSTLTVNTPVPPTPTAVAASNVTSTQPTLTATEAVDGAGRSTKFEWTIATNSGFTTGVKTVIEPDFDYRASGVGTEVVPVESRLTLNGIYWLRARAVTVDGAQSAWSAGVSFTLALPLPAAPSGVTPVDLATVSTDFPLLGATMAALSEDRKQHAEWQIATNNTFASNLKTITENAADNRLSGSTTELVPSGSGLFQGLWYLRARSIDEFGNAGAYSTTQSFTVTHKPVASPASPANDSTSVYATTTFNWIFSDPEPTDTQSAYQFVLERNDTGAVLYDSGKVVSTVKSRSITTATTLKDVKMRWKVRVWDSDDVVGNYSAYQLFTLSDLPVVTITVPTNLQVVTTGAPTVTWTTDAQTTQASYRLIFKRISDGVTILDTNTVSTSVKTYTASANILENLVDYSVTVTVTDTAGLQGSATRNFSTAYESPDPVSYTVDATNYDTLGYMYIDWSAMQADGYFVQWNVYRRKTGEQEWTLLAAYTDPGTTYHRDWFATAGDGWEYAVTQSAGRSGVVLESVVNPTPDSNGADGTHYWLLNPVDESNNLKVDNVSSDSFTDGYEEAELIVIGRGRKMNQGTRLGYDGSLVARFRDDNDETARSKRNRLQQIKSAKASYFLRNPFGDLLLVSVGNLSIERLAGVGVSEYVDVTIPYKEVF